jgi:Leucine-rich repeat (LRR) protein
MSGPLPTEIGLLTELEYLYVHVLEKHFSHNKFRSLNQNSFTGSIPTEVSKLTKLRILDLSENYMSGRIPHQMGALNATMFL